MAFAAEPTLSSARDFDFWMGRWNVRNRRLRARLDRLRRVGRVRGDERGPPDPGRARNEDEFRTGHAGGFVGMSFRFFDPATRRWSIYWADSRRPGELDPPVFGTFSGDIGVFEGDDVVRGSADQCPLHLVGHEDADAAVGAGLLRRRRRDLGDELDHGLQPG